MKVILSRCLIVLLLTLTLSGCQAQDVGKRAFVSVIGIDAADKDNKPVDEGRTESGEYEVTVEIVKPSIMRTTSEKPANVIFTAKGESIGKALDQMQTRIAYPLTLVHLRSLLIGEKVARENINDIVSFFEKNPEIARRLRIAFIQDGKAGDIIRTKPLFAKTLSQELIAMTQLEPVMPLARNVAFAELTSNLRANEGRGFGTRALLDETNKQIIRHGGAILKDWKLAAWLNADLTRKTNWIIGKSRQTVTAKVNKSLFTYQTDYKKAEISPEFNEGKLSFKVRIKTDGTILQEQGTDLDLSDPKNLSKLEKLFSQVISNEVKEAIAVSQKRVQIDYIAFEKALKDKKPEVFEKMDWEKDYPSIPVKVEVDAKISKFGLAR